MKSQEMRRLMDIVEQTMVYEGEKAPLTIENSNGIPFNVTFSYKTGDEYHDKPVITIYDARFTEKFGSLGQQISAYYWDTVDKAKGGINLHGGVDNWFIDKENVDEIRTWVKKNHLNKVEEDTLSEDIQDKLLSELQNKFGIKARRGSEWGEGSPLVWSGEDAYMPSGVPAFNYNSWESDPEELTYVLGVHKQLVAWAEKKGLYWEFYDPGTVLLYKI